MYNIVRYYVVPPLFVALFTASTQLLVALGNPSIEFGVAKLFNFGNTYSWTVVFSFMLWGFLSLKIPAKEFCGPATPAGYIPRYSANGTQYYLVSLVVYLVLVYIYPAIPLDIYDNFDSIISCLNLFSLLFCILLLVKGKICPEIREGALDKPNTYLFYAGIELHPRMFGVDVKQWTNCRVGMMGWALLVLNFCIASVQKNTFHLGPVACALLFNLYLLKFFYWETGYFNTLDITLDRAGYYLCWGCLTWVQVFYTFCAYYLVANPAKISNSGGFVILVLGLLALALNYMADYQKEKFKASDGKCLIWGRKAEFIPVEYHDHEGKKRQSKLLISGFWGIARHMNYVWEILLALAWSLPNLGNGPLPFMYLGFLIILLVHRTFRDDEKCSRKYGPGWTAYCKQVPYKIIPFIF